MGIRAARLASCFVVATQVSCAIGLPSSPDAGEAIEVDAPVAPSDSGVLTEQDTPTDPPTDRPLADQSQPDVARVDVRASDVGTRLDAGGADVRVDVPSLDVAIDVGVDAGRADVGFDVGVPDVGFDTGFDIGVPDVGRADTGTPDAGPSRPYTVLTPSPQAWVDACAAAGRRTYLHSADDLWVNTESVGFEFEYWGVRRAAAAPLAIDSNGWMSLSPYSPAGPDNPTPLIPSAGIPNGVIAAQWADLVLFESLETNQFVCVATVGSSPNRRYVVEWQNARYFAASTSRLYFEIVLTETAHTIDLIYNRLERAQAATIGIENLAGTEAISPCSSGVSCGLATGQSFRFVPNR